MIDMETAIGQGVWVNLWSNGGWYPRRATLMSMKFAPDYVGVQGDGFCNQYQAASVFASKELALEYLQEIGAVVTNPRSLSKREQLIREIVSDYNGDGYKLAFALLDMLDDEQLADFAEGLDLQSDEDDDQ